MQGEKKKSGNLEVTFSRPTLSTPATSKIKRSTKGWLPSTFAYSTVALSRVRCFCFDVLSDILELLQSTSKMPPKKGKSKITFKIFSTTNHSKFASRFPFLKERQIKAKLLQAWRNTFTSETTKDLKGNIKKTKHRNETPLNGGKTSLFLVLL